MDAYLPQSIVLLCIRCSLIILDLYDSCHFPPPLRTTLALITIESVASIVRPSGFIVEEVREWMKHESLWARCFSFNCDGWNVNWLQLSETNLYLAYIYISLLLQFDDYSISSKWIICLIVTTNFTRRPSFRSVRVDLFATTLCRCPP